MRFKKLALLASGTILMGIGSANAQSNAPAFRVPIGDGSNASSLPPVHAWMESVSECSSTCGTGNRTTSYQCQNVVDFDYSGAGYGAPEADALCVSSSGPKPASTNASCVNYSGCGYDWVKPPVQQTPIRIDPNPIGRVGCGLVRTVFAPYCQRTGGSSPVVMAAGDHRFCRNDTPDYNDVASGNADALGYDRNVTQLTACNTSDHEWRSEGWGAWSSTCSNTATQTRVVSCYRKFDNQVVANDQCNASTKPASSQTQGVYTSCSYDWIGAAESDWSAWNSSCSSTATRTRNPQCRRSTGDVVADSECTSRNKPKPASTQTQPVYSACTYSAGGTTTYGNWSSQCSANAQRSVTRQCIRSNGDVVADSECSSRNIALTSTQTQAVYDQCGYSFATGEWGSWNDTCSNSATRTRSVTCMRQDGTAVADSECTNRNAARPDSSETAPVYSSCTYSAGGSTTYGGWSSQCSANAQRNVTRQCIRSNGDVVASAECTNRGIAVTSTQTAAVYDGCGYSFSTSGWSDWNSHCSASATRTRSVQCVREDGTAMTDAECTNRGISRPNSSETAAVYDQCGYSYETGGWSDWNSHCSGSATRTRSVQCVRADGTGVADSECANRGITRPAASETAGVYDQCGYSRGAYTGSSDWNSHCSANATRTNYYNCNRSDGTVVAAAECTNRGIAVTAQENGAVYDQCGYAFQTGGWSDWNSHCSGSATRTRSVQCVRQDGTAVSDAECTNRGITKPAVAETTGVYDQCSYSAVNWTPFTACSNGQQTSTAECRRSDGALIDVSLCNANGVATTQTRACTTSKSCGWGALQQSGFDTTGFNMGQLEIEGAQAAASNYSYGSFYAELNSTKTFVPSDVGSNWMGNGTPYTNYRWTQAEGTPMRRSVWLFCQYSGGGGQGGTQYRCQYQGARVGVCQ